VQQTSSDSAQTVVHVPSGISYVSVVNPSGDDLVFGAVKLSEFYSEEELEELFAEESNEEDEEEQYFLDLQRS
jgi:hypothetical protein